MISRSNYQGRLPYEEYIKRFQSAQDLDKELKQNVKKENWKHRGCDGALRRDPVVPTWGHRNGQAPHRGVCRGPWEHHQIWGF